jgi:acylphosphatase
MADRRIYTRRGPLEINVYATARGYVAELPDGSLSAFAATEDEAVARLAEAVERSPASFPVQPTTRPEADPDRY